VPTKQLSSYGARHQRDYVPTKQLSSYGARHQRDYVLTKLSSSYGARHQRDYVPTKQLSSYGTLHQRDYVKLLGFNCQYITFGTKSQNGPNVFVTGMSERCDAGLYGD
jgi:hypothetical protein